MTERIYTVEGLYLRIRETLQQQNLIDEYLRVR